METRKMSEGLNTKHIHWGRAVHPYPGAAKSSKRVPAMETSLSETLPGSVSLK